ncbi:PilZ domain-containing protein [Paremcibacter congregatus]|nr:PilZ domain-containing protein [Paremcibacter congregatus]
MRKHNRRTMVQPAVLGIGSFDFECTAYDVSLGGIRIKADLPVERNASVYVQMRHRLRQNAKVVWAADGFMGLRFIDPPEKVKMGLGSLSNGLN